MPNLSLSDILWDAKTCGDRIFLQSARTSHRILYSELEHVVSTWESQFATSGITPDQHVGLAVDDPVTFSILYLALLHFGATVVPMNPEAPALEMERIATKAFLSHLILSQPRSLSVQAEEWVVSTESSELQASSNPLQQKTRTTQPPTDPFERAAVLLFTSGTTGEPKGVALTQQQLLHTARAVARHHQLTPSDRGYCCLPLFHINAQVVAVLATLIANGTMILDRRFHKTGFWELMQTQGITWINAVPAIITLLANNPPEVRPRQAIRFIRSASAPLPIAIIKRFESFYRIPIIETYGMTEAASQITANPLPPQQRKMGSVGIPVDVRLKIVDPAGNLVGPNQLGEIVIQGPSVIKHYVHMGTDESAAFVNGWFNTGDIGHQDADGYVYIAARMREFINRGGQKIPPREVEEILLLHPGVSAAAVIGIPHPVLGEEMEAYVTLNHPMEEEAVISELDRLCQLHLSAYKRPAVIHVTDDLPKGPTGKIQRRRLREMVLSGDTYNLVHER